MRRAEQIRIMGIAITIIAIIAITTTRPPLSTLHPLTIFHYYRRHCPPLPLPLTACSPTR